MEKISEKIEIDEKEAEKLSSYLLLTALNPIIIIIITGIISGTIITLIRFNWWQFIYPFLGKTLPPLLTFYIFLFSAFAFILFTKFRGINQMIEEKKKNGIVSKEEFENFSQELLKLPQQIFIFSLSFWGLSIILTIIALLIYDIRDIQTYISYSLTILSLAFPVSFMSANTLGEKISKIIKSNKIPYMIYPKLSIPLKWKIIGGTISATVFCMLIFSLLHIEQTIRNFRENKAIKTEEDFMLYPERKEEIAGKLGVVWEISKNSESVLFEKWIQKGIREKLKVGENILFDYLSPSVFIFREKDEKTIEGILVPMKEIEDIAKGEFLKVIFVMAILITLSFLILNQIFGSYPTSFIQEYEKRIFITDDELFRLSIFISHLAYKTEKLEEENRVSISEMSRGVSQIYSELSTIRSKIQSSREKIKHLKPSLQRIIQLSARETEIEKISLDYNLENISQNLLNSVRTLKNIRERVEQTLSELLKFSNINIEIKDSIQQFQEERSIMVETKLSKKIEFARSSLRKIEDIIGKLENKIKSFSETAEKIENSIKGFSEITEGMDKLRKKLVILSMNTTIISARGTDVQMKNELSTIAKQMPTIIEEIRKVESETKNLKTIIDKLEEEFKVLQEEEFAKDIIDQLSGLIKGIDDILEDEISPLIYDIINQSSDTRRNLKRILGKATEIESFLGKIGESFAKAEREKNSLLMSFGETIDTLERISSKASEFERKFEKLSTEFKALAEKYINLKKEFQSSLYSIRSESQKLLSHVEETEKSLNEIRTAIDGIMNYIMELVQKIER